MWGRLTDLDESRQEPIVFAVGPGGGCLDIFVSPIMPLLSLPL